MSPYRTPAVPVLFGPRDRCRQAVLEEIANRLLATGEPASHGEYPWCREYRLTELSRQGRRLVPPPDPAPLNGRDQRRLYLRLLSRLPLSTRQRLAFRLRARGQTCEQVAALLGVTPGHVRNLNRLTCRRLRAALGAEGESLLPPGEALRQTYREMVARRGYTPEKHCPPGQEECRGSGMCTRRWYLYFAAQPVDWPE